MEIYKYIFGNNFNDVVFVKDKMKLSFQFTDYIFHVEHKHINDIGKFALFSLRMFRDGHAISEISEITNIEQMVIEKQLLFLKEKKYITDDYKLNDEAINVLELYDLIEKNNTTKSRLAFDQYIKEEKHKELLCKEILINNTESPKGFELTPMISNYKIETIFKEMNETGKDIECLILFHPEYQKTIENNQDEFIFSLKNPKNISYCNQDILIEDFMNIKEDINSKNIFAIPFCTNNVSIKEKDEEMNDWIIKNSEKLNSSYSLLDGSKLDLKSINIIDLDTKMIELPKIKDPQELLSDLIKIPLKFFFNENLKRSLTVGYYSKKISDESFNNLMGI